jgi:GNAT superfamily N-acetyltransferase
MRRLDLLSFWASVSQTSGYPASMTTLRPVKPSDLETICRQREEMFREAERSEDVLRPMTTAFRRWLAPHLESGVYAGFIAEEGGVVAGGLGLMVVDWPPHPEHPQEDKRGYVLNVYVEPAFRRRGIASLLMAACEAEFARRGVSFRFLHATKMGMPLYKDAGWTHTAEMAKRGPPGYSQ